MEEKLLITEEIANHELNSDLGLDLLIGSELFKEDPKDKPCPPDTADGYYIKSGGNCVFIPYG